jgi:hypothetical protein
MLVTEVGLALQHNLAREQIIWVRQASIVRASASDSNPPTTTWMRCPISAVIPDQPEVKSRMSR